MPAPSVFSVRIDGWPSTAIKRSQAEVRAATDLRRHYAFVTGDLIGIDLAVVIDVEQCEESRGVLLHLDKRQPAVVILVSLVEPVAERITVMVAERFAHRADENAPSTRRRRRNRDSGRNGGESEEGSEEHHGE